MGKQRMLSDGVKVKDFDATDPMKRAQPTQAEVSDAMMRLGRSLRDMASKHHAAGWKEQDDVSLQLVTADDAIILRGILIMERDS